MTYVEKTVIGAEKLLTIARLHWIYLAQGFFWFALLTGIGLGIDHYLYEYAGLKAVHFKIDLHFVQFDEEHTPIPWIFGAAGLAFFWPLFIHYISAEIGLTDQRVIYKHGLIFVKVNEIDLEDVRGENVSHGWLGWLFNYGQIMFDCRFIENLEIPAIPDPYKFVKASHNARLKHPLIDYTEQDMELNLAEIDKCRKNAMLHQKLKRLGRQIKNNFRAAS